VRGGPARPAAGVLLAAGMLAAAGCGGAAAPAPPSRPVRLALSAPGDGAVVRTAVVSLSGRVSPSGAEVRVRGRRASVRGGAFTARVSLEPGVNVVDVLATAPHRRPAVTAIRVRRQLTVLVPDLAGLAVDDAARRLRALPLAVRTRKVGGLLDDILPGDPVVCGIEPASGERVDLGSRVTLLVARLC
jgi:glucodextranase-like protein/PASTA domain-containing protein